MSDRPPALKTEPVKTGFGGFGKTPPVNQKPDGAVSSFTQIQDSPTLPVPSVPTSKSSQRSLFSSVAPKPSHSFDSFTARPQTSLSGTRTNAASVSTPKPSQSSLFSSTTPSISPFGGFGEWNTRASFARLKSNANTQPFPNIGDNSNHGGVPRAGFLSSSLVPNHDTRKELLKWLKGPHVEVIVGAEADIFPDDKDVLLLPEPLLVHYSPWMKEACQSYRREDENTTHVRLPRVKPVIFGLFVQWMFYGTYTLEKAEPNQKPELSMDIQAWMLGDLLQSVAFKNYTMGRVFAKHTILFGAEPLTILDAAFVFDNSPKVSKIRNYFTDFLKLYFSDSARIKDSTQDWSKIVGKHEDLRIALLERLRQGHDSEKTMTDRGTYMESSPAQSVEAVVPAKRNAAGSVIQSQGSVQN